MDFKRLISQHFFCTHLESITLCSIKYSIMWSLKKKKQTLICAYLRLLLVLCFTVHIKTLHVENKKSTKTQNKKN